MESLTESLKKFAQHATPTTVEGIALNAEQAEIFKWLSRVGENCVDVIGPGEQMIQLRGPQFMGDDELLTLWVNGKQAARPMYTKKEVAQIISKCRLA